MTEIKMENGRSMVEMLGVLAVMGVLSIGGVAGYRYAMDKMNANDIINEVRKRAITASQQRVLGQNINLAEYGDNGRIKGQHAVTAANAYQGDKGFFALTVSAVPQRVCDAILKMDWAMPVETAVGGVVVDDDTTCAAGENEMLFAFANTLDNSLAPGEAGEDDGDEEVDDGDDPWAQECGTNEYHDPNTGECVVDEDCGEGTFLYERWGRSECLTCPDATNPVAGDGYSYMGTCTKCPGAKEGSTSCGYYCVYCPNGEACNNQCCGDGEWCQYNASTYSYECVSEKTEGECYNNSDCTGENQYCRSYTGCQMANGTCETINSTTVTINEKTYTASTYYISYHAAENFCDALGKKLAPVTDGCTSEELAAVKANNYYGSCTGWARTTGNYYWTATKLSGCSSYYVSSSRSGAVGSYYWHNPYDGLALCR